MAEEVKKEVSLSDLGLAEEETPAEKAIKSHTTNIINTGTTEIEVKKFDNIETQQEGPKKAIPRPDTVGQADDNGFQVVTDINSIAKIPIREATDPIKETWDNFNELMEEGIIREKNELSAPNGRIAEGKEKYVEDKYRFLMQRAKESSSLNNKIKELEKAMEIDPGFDDITDYERHAYILYKIAKDNTLGIDDRSFGLHESVIKKSRNTSKANEKHIEQMVNGSSENKVETPEVIVDEATQSIIPEEKEEEKPKENLNIINSPNDDEDDLDELLEEVPEPQVKVVENNTLNVDDNEEDEVEEADIDEATQKQIEQEYYKDVKKLLWKENGIPDDFSSYTVGNSINLKSALQNIQQTTLYSSWPLIYSGIPYKCSAFSGEELTQFIDDFTRTLRDNATPNLNNARDIYYPFYRHDLNNNKGEFEDWLRRIASDDINSLVFGQYNAIFKDCNYFTYRCPKKSCGKIFLQQKPIMDMIQFPNDDAKKSFYDILGNDASSNNLYKTAPIPISSQWAFAFSAPSIYTIGFEPLSVSEETRKKYANTLFLMAYVEGIYQIDHVNKKFNKVDFGGFKGDIEKTVLRKVKAIHRILKSLTTDQRGILQGEHSKLFNRLRRDELVYKTPESVCPKCGEKIPEEVSDPLNLLFTRAQLSTEAVSTLEQP